MYQLLQIVLDLIFPPSASEQLVRTCTPTRLRQSTERSFYDEVRTLFPYKDPLIRALIWQLKYNGNSRASVLLGDALREEITLTIKKPRVIIPVPLSPERLRARGFNQVVQFAKVALSDLPQHTLEEQVLRRHHRVTPQAHLSRTERLSSIEGVFYIDHPEKIEGKDLILLDDVVTTGATLRAARSALLKAKPRSVTCIALAH